MASLVELSKELYFKLGAEAIKSKPFKNEQVTLEMINALMPVLYLIHQMKKVNVEFFIGEVSKMFGIEFDMLLIFNKDEERDVYLGLRCFINRYILKYKAIWQNTTDRQRLEWLKAGERQFYRGIVKEYEKEQNEA